MRAVSGEAGCRDEYAFLALQRSMHIIGLDVGFNHNSRTNAIAAVRDGGRVRRNERR